MSTPRKKWLILSMALALVGAVIAADRCAPSAPKGAKKTVGASDLAVAAQKADNALNNQSLVVLFTFAGKTMLFSGDAQWGNWANFLFGGDDDAGDGQGPKAVPGRRWAGRGRGAPDRVHLVARGVRSDPVRLRHRLRLQRRNDAGRQRTGRLVRGGQEAGDSGGRIAAGDGTGHA